MQLCDNCKYDGMCKFAERQKCINGDHLMYVPVDPAPVSRETQIEHFTFPSVPVENKAAAVYTDRNNNIADSEDCPTCGARMKDLGCEDVVNWSDELEVTEHFECPKCGAFWDKFKSYKKILSDVKWEQI